MGVNFLKVGVLLSTLFFSVQPKTGNTNLTAIGNDARSNTISSLNVLIPCCLLRSVARLLSGESQGNTASELPYLFILCYVATFTNIEAKNGTTDDDNLGKVRTLAPWLDYDESQYNPKPGYEPYWPVGEWVYKDPYTTKFSTSTTIPPLIGGRPCPKYYREIKETCTTRLSGFWKVDGCNYENWCWGDMDNIYAYHTFPTFCAFLQYYFKFSQFHRSVFVHTGNCTIMAPYYHPFNPVYDKEHLSVRFDHYMKKLNETFRNITTERDVTLGPLVIKYGADKK